MTHRDPMVFEPESFAAERLPDPDLRSLSSLRRVLVIIGYALAATVAFYLIIDAFVSDACLLQGTCSPMEKLISLSVRIAWIVGTSFVVVLGWRGRLPGARVRHAVTDRRP